MHDSKILNIYAKVVVCFSVVAFFLGLLTVYSSGKKHLFPPVSSYEEFTFEAVQSDELQLALSINTRIRYFSDLDKDNFEEERLLLFRTYRREVEEERLKEVFQGMVYLLLFSILFHMHRKMVHNTGGWKR